MYGKAERQRLLGGRDSEIEVDKLFTLHGFFQKPLYYNVHLS